MLIVCGGALLALAALLAAAYYCLVQDYARLSAAHDELLRRLGDERDA